MNRYLRRTTAAAATLALCALSAPAALADPTPSPSSSPAPPTLGGWQLSASAAPFTMEIYDPNIPIPAQAGQPNLEFDFSYTRANFSSGPSGNAIASWLWPGDAIAFGLGTFLNDPTIKYPVLTNAQFPGQSADQTTQPIPGAYMQSHTDANGASAVSTFGLPLPGTGPGVPPSLPAPTSQAPGLLGGGLLGGLLPPAGQLPDIGTMLNFLLGGGPFVDVEGERSQCITTVSGNTATASADSEAGTLSLLGGLIKFDGLKVSATSTSDGNTGKSTGDVTYGSMTVAGVTFGITANGIVTPFGTIALPQLPAAINTILAPIGITFAEPAATDLSQSAQGQMFSHGMQITIDTSVLKKLLPNTAVLQNLIAQLPSQVTSQLPPQVTSILQALPNLAPKIVITVGSAKSQAIASPPIDVSGDTGGPTTQPGGASSAGGSSSQSSGSSIGGSSSSVGGGTSGGTSGGSYSGGSGSGIPAAVSSSAAGSSGGSLGPGTTTPAAAAEPTAPAAFGGLPGQLTAAALALACVAAWAIRKYSSLLFGSAGCELGHTTTIPELRDQD